MRQVTKLAAAVLCGALGIAPLAACGATSTSAGSGASGSSSSGSGKSALAKVGMAYDVGGRGDQSFNDSAARGLDKAKTQFGFQTKELEAVQGESDADRVQRLQQLASAGYNPVITVGYSYATALKQVAKQYPNTHFAIVDSTDVTGSNITNLVFTEEQSSYLVGMAAALTSKTGTVGFIGGVNVPLIQKFQVGYEQGVHAVKPNDKILEQYLTQPPDTSGFAAPDKGKAAAQGMLSRGADVIYSAAGSSGTGAIEAVNAAGKGKWAIGVDSDQYKQDALAKYKSSILTSAVKNVDQAVYEYLQSDDQGRILSGVQRFSLARGGVGYATSGNFLAPDVISKLEAAKKDIIDGKITVKSTL
ncbi:BMP family lipoprotein [Phaeacidiphilus oryzae]|uniref:BMP family lipoprotein n=1 Tax=Phaeacidiphilus oryzae TaxID=348818 RepID=UPI00056A3EA8|nr:BMP family ABC transporter substrate-binding protein [Phaeacidiphilus oryzae]